MLTLITEAEKAAEGGVNPYIIGAVSLTIAFALLGALLVFGKGREHN